MNSSTELFDAIVAKIEHSRIPLNAHIDLTYRCNLNCVHCYCQNLSPSFSRGQPEMSDSEILKLIDELAEIGSLFLTLSGGEVLLHPSFFKIAEYARKRNFSVTVLTNGMLVDKNMAQRLAGLSLKSVELSIYGASATVHDSITGKIGSFEKLKQAVGFLKDAGLWVMLKSVIMKQNMHEAHQIEDAALAMGADKYISTLEVTVKNDGSNDPKRFQLSEQDLLKLLIDDPDPLPGADQALGQKAEDRPICGCGILGTYISPYGEVYPCIQLLVSMGNIREKNFAQIWRSSSEIRDKLDSIRTYADMPYCRDCKFVGVCKKCLGTVYLETGDLCACHQTQRAILEKGYQVYCKQGGER
ncbi:MAG: radical SAM protein [Candidatus Omnitrophica bacterium]|nr:radical SAM protein [Candidatus Omnitrophota bacterium]